MVSRIPVVLMLAAALIVSTLTVVTVLVLFTLGMYDPGLELPETMQGEASFTSVGGKRELFHIAIDYRQKLVQLSSFDQNNKSINRSASNIDVQIVVQDFNMGRIYYIFQGEGNPRAQCFYTVLQGDMIPRHLLKDATIQAENAEGNMTEIHLNLGNDTYVDAYRAKGHKGKIYEVNLHLQNGTMHLRSTANRMNFTDYKNMDCYKYVEENATFQDKELFESNTSETILSNETTSFSINSLDHNQPKIAIRPKRGIGWRDGWVDWWYGNWCGAKQGGYRNKPNASCKHHCKKSTKFITNDCRNCLPPKDALDEACMEHDRCINDNQAGPLLCQPIGLPCKCDRPFVKRVTNLIGSCPTNSCRSNALQIYTAFKLLSCWYPKRTCFPVVRTKCRCWACLCPRITVSTKCMVLKWCDFLGSGKI